MPKINVHTGLLIAATEQTDSSKLRTYVYHLNFQCLAGDIEEADACFIENTKLSFGEKHKPAWMCPNISREIFLPPMEDAELRRQKIAERGDAAEWEQNQAGTTSDEGNSNVLRSGAGLIAPPLR